MSRPKLDCAVKVIVLQLSLALFAFSAWGQGMGKGIMSPPANVRPPGLTNVGIEQHLNGQIPPGLEFRDETGKPVRLGGYFGRKPLILNLVYYKCPMLCGEVMSGLESALGTLKFEVGKEFDVLTISFDSRETPADATVTKAEYMKRYKRRGAKQGWHFLTGPPESIEALTRAVGFQYQFNEKTGQFAHATAILILTPEGKISRYLYGVEFPPTEIRLGLLDASQGKIGDLTDQLLLYCYHYDPAVGKYGAAITHILQLASAGTLLLLGAFILILFRRGPDRGMHGGERLG